MIVIHVQSLAKRRSVRNVNKQREKIRKSLLLDDISNLFNKFKEKYPELKPRKSDQNGVYLCNNSHKKFVSVFIMRIQISYAHHSQTFHVQKCFKLITSWLVILTIFGKLPFVILSKKNVFGENMKIVQIAAFTNYLSL